MQRLGEKKYVTELAGQHPNWELPSYTFSQISEISKPLALSYELRQTATTTDAASELYVSPLASFGEGRNPFRHADRTYPVDFGAPTQDVIMVTLTLPPATRPSCPSP
ncbi:MAG: hypothetical protein WKG07_02720 [Hymenobacter sp.]